ncbi:hypothetical protein HRG84_20315 [Flavisolibacter sp. BT320]|nr:hypothetical protein [Flavisolibacter longurius]
MTTGLNLSSIYQLRTNFTVIAVTGRTCSGCTTVSKQLTRGFGNGADYPGISDLKAIKHNSHRKYRIIYNYAKENFRRYNLISYKDVIVLFLLKYDLQALINYLQSEEFKAEFKRSKFSVEPNYSDEIKGLEKMSETFSEYARKRNDINFEAINEADNFYKLNALFDSDDYREFTQKFLSCFSVHSLVKRNKFLQIVANNLRKVGEPYSSGREVCPDCIFTIAEVINDIIKSYSKKNKLEGTSTQIVIDSLRNPMEVMFFKQRFSAFYLLSVNRDSSSREQKVAEKYSKEIDDIQKLLAEEYEGAKGSEFYKQYVRDCIQKADIHITYRTNEETRELNKTLNKEGDNTSPYFSWQMQLLKYVSLINQPGLVTPSPEERCMQVAYTAKYNSGCISRQVGATVTDEFYSIKAVGWNNTPEGQVPCSLRNAEDLLQDNGDIEAFTPYERENEFKGVLEVNFKEQIQNNKENLCGRNVCFCFKSLKNSISEGKNQVHTRSLHAEESAFLQITKYGGTGVMNGKLFTTASPCELCSKKAYQLGIKVIYYVDPYPGISEKQILQAGSTQRNPQVRLFNGAIGNAYHWLYEPFMAYKDELSLILSNPVKDKLTKIQEEAKVQKESYVRRIAELEEQVKQLEEKSKQQ